MLQAAIRATLIKEQHFLVERTSALVVRLAAIGKILLGKEDLSEIGDRTRTKAQGRLTSSGPPEIVTMGGCLKTCRIARCSKSASYANPRCFTPANAAAIQHHTDD